MCSLIEERITWPVRSVLCGGGEGYLTPYRDFLEQSEECFPHRLKQSRIHVEKS